MNRILVVEDDIMLGSGLCYNLKLDNYQASLAQDSITAIKKVQAETFDLIILDVNLPDVNGFDLYKKIKVLCDVPIVFLTACDLESDIMNGFELGADDYITKPFNINIFRKKITAILKRCRKQCKENVYICGELTVNFDKLTTTINEEQIILTSTEYKIMKIFTSNPGILLTRQVLLEKLWDCEGNFVDGHALTVNINRLRNKIENDNRKYIKTVYGMGYLWVGDKL